MRERAISAVVIAAVVGILGQISGIYTSLSIIADAQKINPKLVARGFSQSFSTTLFGLTTFLLAAIIWYVLHWQYKKRAAEKE